jgi:hypothetical protein
MLVAVEFAFISISCVAERNPDMRFTRSGLKNSRLEKYRMWLVILATGCRQRAAPQRLSSPRRYEVPTG